MVSGSSKERLLDPQASNRSLLASDILSVEGGFPQQSVVELADENGNTFARGMMQVSGCSWSCSRACSVAREVCVSVSVSVSVTAREASSGWEQASVAGVAARGSCVHEERASD
eukprot:1514330-Rhodomonas_salina.5